MNNKDTRFGLGFAGKLFPPHQLGRWKWQQPGGRLFASGRKAAPI